MRRTNVVVAVWNKIDVGEEEEAKVFGDVDLDWGHTYLLHTVHVEYLHKCIFNIDQSATNAREDPPYHAMPCHAMPGTVHTDR